MESPPVKIKWWEVYKTFGCYQPEYNRRIHGPYDPSVNYAFKDIHWTKVKVGDFPSWLKRRDFSPRGIFGVGSRYLWRLGNITMPYRTGANFLVSLFVMTNLINAALSYKNCLSKFSDIFYLLFFH